MLIGSDSTETGAPALVQSRRTSYRWPPIHLGRDRTVGEPRSSDTVLADRSMSTASDVLLTGSR